MDLHEDAIFGLCFFANVGGNSGDVWGGGVVREMDCGMRGEAAVEKMFLLGAD